MKDSSPLEVWEQDAHTWRTKRRSRSTSSEEETPGGARERRPQCFQRSEGVRREGRSGGGEERSGGGEERSGGGEERRVSGRNANSRAGESLCALREESMESPWRRRWRWRRWRRRCWWLRSSLLLLLCLLTGCEAQCEGCVEYCCDGSPPFCCSYYAYVGDVLSGTAISGIVFGVVFLMGAAAALFLCVCMCVKNGRGARVGVFSTSYISTVSRGYPGPPPPYTYDCEMYPPALRPPPYTPTQPCPANCSPPPPYPGCTRK